MTNAPVQDLQESYPGSPVRRGDIGVNVSFLQVALNRISQNYPAIPKVPVDAILGEATENAVRAFQSMGYDTIASGDSYNDLEMIRASKAGFLFRTTEQIRADYPQYPAFEEYDDLLAAIEQAL